MKRSAIFHLLSAFFILCSAELYAQRSIPLAGTWQFAADPKDRGITERWYAKRLSDKITLPGSMTENGKGDPVTLSTHWTGDILDSSYFKDPRYAPYRQEGKIKVPFWLQPDKYYVGAAWYRKEVNIPSEWNGKSVELFLERCHWSTTVWIDEREIGTQNALGTPHRYDLGTVLSSGKHTITIRVDNRITTVNPGVNSSSITDHSQTNWNGIVGSIALNASDPVSVTDLILTPDADHRLVHVSATISNRTSAMQAVIVTVRVNSPNGTRSAEISRSVNVPIGGITEEFHASLGDSVALWDEFTPHVYTVTAALSSPKFSAQRTETIGVRQLGTKGTQLTINGRPLFLRGTLECAIFPRTGYPSTDVKEWGRIFTVSKQYGLNHMRFHSWCPPEAAFRAADSLGLYLYVECSSWANQGVTLGDGEPVDAFVLQESERIVKEFGDHPSFCFMVYGNEPGGEHHSGFLTSFVRDWKKKDPRRLYSSASGWPQLPENDFHSMYEPRIQLWGAGLSSIINSQAPSSSYDWYNTISWRGKPVISHEIGQWCVYPNFDEIPKYNGVLKAKNFEIFRQTLAENGMKDLAVPFLHASGKLQVLCYKAEIEAALRTKGMGGFQLLDLHDFPGQGTALVGVLDPFWESKGYVTPEEYTQFCSSTVPLARFKKFIFHSAEDLVASVEVSHFGASSLPNIVPQWSVEDSTGKVITQGTLPARDIPVGNGTALGNVRFPLQGLPAPAMYRFAVTVNGHRNQWDFWVYPYQDLQPLLSGPVRVVRALDDSTIAFLNNGGSVLFTPVKGSLKKEFGGDIAVGFSSIFWNTAWTNKQPPHTLGILCDPAHPVFRQFPTQYHSNMQWWDAMSHANAMILTAFGEGTQPLLRAIDDWFTNRPLGLLVEGRIGKGKILISGIDLLTDAEKRPEARQLTASIITYMRSTAFAPVKEISPGTVRSMFTARPEHE